MQNLLRFGVLDVHKTGEAITKNALYQWDPEMRPVGKNVQEPYLGHPGPKPDKGNKPERCEEADTGKLLIADNELSGKELSIEKIQRFRAWFWSVFDELGLDTAKIKKRKPSKLQNTPEEFLTWLGELGMDTHELRKRLPLQPKAHNYAGQAELYDSRRNAYILFFYYQKIDIAYLKKKIPRPPQIRDHTTLEDYETTLLKWKNTFRNVDLFKKAGVQCYYVAPYQTGPFYFGGPGKSYITSSRGENYWKDVDLVQITARIKDKK